MDDLVGNHELVTWVFQYHFEFYADFHQTGQEHDAYSHVHELQLLIIKEHESSYVTKEKHWNLNYYCFRRLDRFVLGDQL